MRSFSVLAPFSLVALLALPAPGTGQAVPFGPLISEDGAPLHRVSLTPGTDIADPLPAGALEVGVWNGWTNTFEQDVEATHDLMVDLERLITRTTVRYGVADGLEAGVDLTFESTGGGILDGFVEAWHNFFNLGNANRGRFPRGRHSQTLVADGSRGGVDLSRGSFVLRDVRLSAKWRAWRSADTSSVASVKVVAGIPTTDRGAGDERADVALMGLTRTRLWGFHLHGQLGGVTTRLPEDLDGAYKDGPAWYLTLALERPLLDWVSGIVQGSLLSSRLQGFEGSEVDGRPSIMVFGFAGRFGDGWRWEASFQEDVPASRPSADFTWGFGLRRRVR